GGANVRFAPESPATQAVGGFLPMGWRRRPRLPSGASDACHREARPAHDRGNRPSQAPARVEASCRRPPGRGRRAGAAALARTPDLGQIIKAYDVRGTYPDQLDESVAHDVGAAFVRLVGAAGGQVVVGHDMRPSSGPLVDAFTAGATGQGADVVHVGLVSTDA